MNEVGMADPDTKQEVVELWTDGACKGNPGPGGWGRTHALRRT